MRIGSAWAGIYWKKVEAYAPRHLRATTRVVVVLLLMGTSSFLAGCGDEPRPSILLITVDTLRADHLDPYRSVDDPFRGTTPRVDRFAREAMVFEQATAPMPLTRPSHFSLLTSRYPREHGVVNNQINLPESEHSLVEILQEAGYRTGAVVGVKLLDRSSGSAQGFDFFEAPVRTIAWAAPEVIDRSLAWLSKVSDGAPFFLWVHLFDPHQAYDPPAGYRKGLDPALRVSFPSLSWSDFVSIAKANAGNIPREVLEHARGLYRGEVEAIDRQLGRLIDGFDSMRPKTDTLVILTADHGECFENGNYFEHSDCLLEGALRIPLVVRAIGRITAGRTVDVPVSLLDVAPTILEMAGLSVPKVFSGRSLVEARNRDNDYVLFQRPFYQPGVLDARLSRHVIIRRVAGDPVEPFTPEAQVVGIRTKDWKYLRDRDSEKLYAMTPTPRESENLATKEQEVRREMSGLLDEALRAHPLRVIDAGEINAELLQSLQALGYVE